MWLLWVDPDDVVARTRFGAHPRAWSVRVQVDSGAVVYRKGIAAVGRGGEPYWLDTHGDGFVVDVATDPRDGRLSALPAATARAFGGVADVVRLEQMLARVRRLCARRGRVAPSARSGPAPGRPARVVRANPSKARGARARADRSLAVLAHWVRTYGPAVPMPVVMAIAAAARAGLLVTATFPGDVYAPRLYVDEQRHGQAPADLAAQLDAANFLAAGEYLRSTRRQDHTRTWRFDPPATANPRRRRRRA